MFFQRPTKEDNKGSSINAKWYYLFVPIKSEIECNFTPTIFFEKSK